MDKKNPRTNHIWIYMKRLYQNISNTTDHTYNYLKKLIKSKNLFVEPGYKESSVIIINNQD